MLHVLPLLGVLVGVKDGAQVEQCGEEEEAEEGVRGFTVRREELRCQSGGAEDIS